MVRRLAHCAGVIIAVVEDDGVASAAVDIHSAGESLGVPPVGKGLLSTLQENGTPFGISLCFVPSLSWQNDLF